MTIKELIDYNVQPDLTEVFCTGSKQKDYTCKRFFVTDYEDVYAMMRAVEHDEYLADKMVIGFKTFNGTVFQILFDEG